MLSAADLQSAGFTATADRIVPEWLNVLMVDPSRTLARSLTQNRLRLGRPATAVTVLLVTVLLIVAVVVAVVFRSRDSPATVVVPDRRPAVAAKLGVFRGTDPAQIQAFGAWLGRTPDYVVDFSARDTWQDIAAPQYLINAWQGTPYRKVYSVALLPQDPADTIARGAAGAYNGYFKDLAHRLVAAGQQDAIVRLGWEFNLPDSRWSTGDSQAFIGYWRQVVAAMRAEPGQQFQFDWNPNNGDAPVDAVDYYPGDDVVDYLGIDAYDVAYSAGTYPYPADCDPACRAQHQSAAWNSSIAGGARGLNFWSGFAAQHGKPLSLPEWGLWQRADGHGGGDDPDYLRRMAAFIADRKNRVAFQAYFEVDGPDGAHRLMTTFAQSGAVYRSLFAAAPTR